MELNRLIETEQRNDEVVRRATKAAEDIVRSAMEAVRQKEAAFSDELQGAIAANAGIITTERETRIAQIKALAAADISRYESSSDAQVLALSQVLVDQLVAALGVV